MIRKLLKWFFYLCLLLLAGIVALVLCKDTIIRNLTERRITDQTGMYVRIDRLHVGFTEPIFSMQGFKLYNRPEYGGGLLLHLQDLDIEYDFQALQSGEVHLALLRLDLAELNIIRNAEGRTNITDFIDNAVVEGRDTHSRKIPKKDIGFTGIDVLDLSLGHVRYTDQLDPRNNRDAFFNLKNLEIKNIRNEGDLYGVAAIVLLRSGVLKQLAPPKPEPSRPSGVLGLGMDWLKEALGFQRGGAAQISTNRPVEKTPKVTPPTGSRSSAE